ncbi:hypothetical protein FQN49_002599 [Arthroderma sp. PD_2]|nr:hypothetical protein FQN49_002599 [Arthroderma sp. PD_2]
MKFTVAAVAAFATLAAANTSLTPEQQCASKCATTDICCKAICFNVPCPTNQNAKDTTKCAAECPIDQGPKAYATCQQGCVASYFYTSGGTPTAAPTGSSPTGGSSTATTTGASPSGTSGSGSGSEESGSESGSEGSGSSPSATESGSGSEPSESGNAAASNAKIQLGSAAGVVGLIAAAFAL